jgi:hypothetical protein
MSTTLPMTPPARCGPGALSTSRRRTKGMDKVGVRDGVGSGHSPIPSLSSRRASV